MKEYFRFGKSFGPVASYSGITIFFSGLALLYFSFFSMFLVLAGGFIGFTYLRTCVDYEYKRIRHEDVLFGIIPAGKWMSVEKDMRMEIREERKLARVYSRGNRSMDISVRMKVLYLVRKSGGRGIPVMHGSNADELKEKGKIMCGKLQIDV